MIYKYSVRPYMVIKTSFNYFKNQKTNFGLSILKLETLLLLYFTQFIPFYNILSIYSDLDSNKKKFSCSLNKHAIYKFVLNIYKLVKHIFRIYKVVNIFINITKKTRKN